MSGYRPHGSLTRYNAGCRCDDCTTAKRDYARRYRKAKGTGTGEAAKIVECGTRSAYQGGCRCAPCREANGLYLAAYKAQRREQYRQERQRAGAESKLSDGIASTPGPGPWTEQGACRGHGDLFFPARGVASVADQRAICDGCPVRQQCLEYAVSIPAIRGIWGGTTRRERELIRARYGEAAAA